MLLKILLPLGLLLAQNGLLSQAALPYRNAQLDIETRVHDLLGRMTNEEKFAQIFMVAGDLSDDSLAFDNGLFGFQMNAVAAKGSSQQIMSYQAGGDALATLQRVNEIQRFFVEETRLGIPMIPFDEALHGLVRTGATCFPQSIAMAASFDTTLMHAVAAAIAQEVKARGLRMVLSPVVNLATDVRWGRVEETYGEDVFLASKFGVIYVQNMERMGLVATPKHFVVNHGEGGRDSYPIFGNNRYAHENYFKPFCDAIQLGGARSIMTAYNSYDGRPCTANAPLLKDLLRDQWGFNGFVISDAAATGGANVLHFTASDYADAGQQAIENGLDVIFQTHIHSAPLFSKPFVEQVIAAPFLDSAVARVLRVKFQLGLFENPYLSDQAIQALDRTQHRALAHQMALESAVLLKNDHQALPIPTHYKNIAVIGIDAKEARLGGYSGPGNAVVSLWDGLQATGAKDIRWHYAPGPGRMEEKYTVISSNHLHCLDERGATQSGLMGRYFTDMSMQNAPVFQRIDGPVDFQWTLFSPDPRLPYDHYGVIWEGTVMAPTSGIFEIGVEGNDGYVLYLHDRIVIDRSADQSYHTTVVPYTFKQGEPVPVRIVYRERAGNARFRLIWNAEKKYEGDALLQEAVAVAEKSEAILAVVGIEEGEFRDRSDLRLPGRQEELLLRLAALDKPVYVVLSAGSAVDTRLWESQVEAIATMWYPGEMGGKAMAELLLGQANFSGKLPITFPASVGQAPMQYNHYPTGRGDDYLDGSGQAMYPFGYGLSYTQFQYSDLSHLTRFVHANDTITLRFKLKNVGNTTGTEVVQLYLRDELASLARPVKSLRDFARITLKPGEETVVQFRLDFEDFCFLNNDLQPIIEPGDFRIMIGSSSKDIRLRSIITYQP